jgi:hypothetical protein
MRRGMTVAFSGRLASATLRFDPRGLSWVIEVGPVTLTARQFVSLGIRVMDATATERRDLVQCGFLGERAGAAVFSRGPVGQRRTNGR